MEKEKRKLSPVNEGAGRRTRSKSKQNNNNGAATATEAKVEEFFTIIKQLHSVAVRTQKHNGGGAHRGKLLSVAEKDGSGSNHWNPVFECEDFGENNHSKDNDDKRNRDEEDPNSSNLAGFDLNAEPPLSVDDDQSEKQKNHNEESGVEEEVEENNNNNNNNSLGGFDLNVEFDYE